MAIALLASGDDGGGSAESTTAAPPGPTYNDFLGGSRTTPTRSRRCSSTRPRRRIEVSEADGETYVVGFPANTQASLLNTLKRNGIEATVLGE